MDSLPSLFASHSTITKDVSRAAAKGLLRKVGPRLYTPSPRGSPEQIIVAHALVVASIRHPGCVLSHRSALEGKPAEGHLFLTGPAPRTDRLPGLTISITEGPGPLRGDTPLLALHQASLGRAFLENLASQRRAAVPRTLSLEAIEAALESQLRDHGEARLNRIREDARAVANDLGAEQALVELERIIGTLLRTRESELSAATAVARVAGKPFDPNRVALLESLATELGSHWSSTERPCPPMLRSDLQNLAFVEAYFSNYIEGTEFEIEEARQVVFDDLVPAHRPADAHDIKGTFELLVDESEMAVSAAAFDRYEDFEALLRRRHVRIMGARTEANPGVFKTRGNRAGNTVFVTPELVAGTLDRAFAILRELPAGFCRAAFVMFAVAEVHPFDDGNGRLARAMMSAELSAVEQHRILVVTSYRPDYLGALRRLSRRGDPTLVPRMLDRAHELSSRLDYSELDPLLDVLRSVNAFDDSETRIMKMPPPRTPE